MTSRLTASLGGLLSTLVVFLAAEPAFAQRGYGITSDGELFRFDVDAPAGATMIGPVGFVPEGIDFRPGTSSLYALDVGPITTQLYTIDIHTGAATAVGAGFSSSGAGYDLTTNQTFGFDFNPTTLQADDSMRIRVVGASNTNLRLNSSTGLIAVVDTSLAFANGNSPLVDGAAYINNIAKAGGVTALYDLDSRNDALLLQSPPNAGTLTEIGPFGVTVNAERYLGFDIYTTPGSTDDTIGGDFAFAVMLRPGVPEGNPLGEFLLYDLNLATGQIANGALVGPADAPFDFEGGFAVNPVPEPATLSLALIACAATVIARWKRT